MIEELPDLGKALAGFLVRPLVVLGIGNELRGDDGFGVLAAELLISGGPIESVTVLQVGTAPETYAERIVRESPRTVLAFDAADFGGRPGELRLLWPSELGWKLGAGSHAPSLELLADYIEARCGAKMAVLAAQPLTLKLGAEPSPELRDAAARAAKAVRMALRIEAGYHPYGPSGGQS